MIHSQIIRFISRFLTHEYFCNILWYLVCATTFSWMFVIKIGSPTAFKYKGLKVWDFVDIWPPRATLQIIKDFVYILVILWMHLSKNLGHNYTIIKAKLLRPYKYRLKVSVLAKDYLRIQMQYCDKRTIYNQHIMLKTNPESQN